MNWQVCTRSSVAFARLALTEIYHNLVKFVICDIALQRGRHADSRLPFLAL